ncbi:hypothetical protein FB451DRAFT_1231486 [Mycena latifolia]|nr:hypothetical protein FB451DRAFT_1231486 [Mycena latifolia]
MDTQKFEFTSRHKALGSLRPVTSYGTGRYENSTLVAPFPREIPLGLFTTSQDPEPEYLPPLWSAQVHPEGQLYFYREGPLRVVTEAYLYQPETLDSVCLWIERIQDILSSTKTIVSGDIELFIKLEGDDCAYYFVDHATRTQFWLESCSTEKLGLPPVISLSQLKIVLEELYWLHVEHFPMHLEGLSAQALEEIIGIFSHGLCDQMTSRVSTFLYTAQDCKAFLTILQGCRGNMNNGHTTWIIARLWSIIDHNKYITHYGQEHSRLSRDQSILFDPTQKHRWISTILAIMTFKASDTHLARLDDVFVDKIVYVDQWERFMGDCLRQWRSSAYGVSIPVPSVLTALIPSQALSGLLYVSPLPSAYLYTHNITLRLHLPFLVLDLSSHHTRSPVMLIHIRQMNYLDAVQSPVFKFQLLAFAFSLPKALHLWGFLVLFANCVLLAAEYLGFGAAMAFTGVSLFLVVSLYCTVSESFHASLVNCAGAFYDRRQEDGAQMV